MLIDVCVPYGERPDLIAPYLKARQAWEHEGATVYVGRHWSKDGTFSQSRARNMAASLGTAPWILFVDADMVIEPGGLEIMERLTDEWSGAYNLVGWRTPDPMWPNRTADDLPIDAIERWYLEPYSPDSFNAFFDCAKVWLGNRVYGPVLVSREAWAAVGGYCEDFTGWGGEDDEFLIKLRRQGLQLRPSHTPRFIQCPHVSTRLVDPRGVYQRNCNLLYSRIADIR